MSTQFNTQEIQNAYECQKQFLAKILPVKGIGGFKAAASSKAAQKMLGISSLMTGVLYADGKLLNGTTLTKKDFVLPKVETEIGFRLLKDVTHTLHKNEVNSVVSEILPVFEIADIKLPEPVQLTSMIGNNTFSSHYVEGTPMPKELIDPNEICPKLYFNGVLVSEGRGSDAMDNQWEALRIAINQSITFGYSPKANDLIITGAIGKILPIKAGEYLGDYGRLGKLTMQVI